MLRQILRAIPTRLAVETETVTLFYNRFLELQQFNDIWDFNVALTNLNLTNAVAARLYGTVRIMNDEAGIAVKINDVEVESAVGTQTWNFNLPNILAMLYQGHNKFTFTAWRAGIFPVRNTYYATMILEVDYPEGEKPDPPDPPDPNGNGEWDWQTMVIIALVGVGTIVILPPVLDALLRPRR